MAQIKSSELESAFNNIMDTFSGGNNTAFIHLLFLLQSLDFQANNGDNTAQELLNLVIRFSRFIDVAQKDLPKKCGLTIAK
jgi:hypothetical protein